ncbi:hypothetical protein ACI79D_13745 [Geodermatophilus sp. SYSU D00708]
MIGDFGAFIIRLLVEHLVGEPAHFAAGGGHRGEFDMVISTDRLLLLGEIKASPLVAFPIVAMCDPLAEEHLWVEEPANSRDWGLFIGAAEGGPATLALHPPTSDIWPFEDFLAIAQDANAVDLILGAWKQHLEGYRSFNLERPSTRWHRFGCGNIETTDASGRRIQLRVDNTKSLPGIDRTDDIKKGFAQAMLFDRLKKGCRMQAVKTVLFGNLFAETHHEHYLQPLASVRMTWPGQESVWLLDAIYGLSRNIINDAQVEALLPLVNEPYPDDSVNTEVLIDDLFAGDESDEDD